MNEGLKRQLELTMEEAGLPAALFDKMFALLPLPPSPLPKFTLDRLIEQIAAREVEKTKFNATLLADELSKRASFVPPKQDTFAVRPDGEMCLALDCTNERILLSGAKNPIGTVRDYEIIAALVAQSKDDRKKGLNPANHHCFPMKRLARKAGDGATRKRLSRLRKLFGGELNSIIQNRPHRGYRINPAVHLVEPDQISAVCDEGAKR